MLTRIRKSTEEREEGFTLVELLVVVIIIGILAAIAVPTFLNQREKAWARASQSDLRNAATVMESHFGDAGSYAVASAPALTAASFKVSDDVTLSIYQDTATGYCMQADHAKLPTADTYTLNSTTGKPVRGASCTGTASLTVTP
jgi:type IV pilus assembly protein PilA